MTHLATTTMREIQIHGPDATTFLQNTITQNPQTPKPAAYAGLLTPQGKILSAFFLIKSQTHCKILIPQTLAQNLANKLNLYKLRANIRMIEKNTNLLITWGNANPQNINPPSQTFPDPRLPKLGTFSTPPENAPDIPAPSNSVEDWQNHCRAQGVPDWSDIEWGADFPTEINMDLLNGIDYEKGCFIGQEVVSRIKRRGLARARMILAPNAPENAPRDTPIEAGGRQIGVLRRGGKHGLALTRLDRLKEAEAKSLTPTVKGEPIRLQTPPWMRG